MSDKDSINKKQMDQGLTFHSHSSKTMSGQELCSNRDHQSACFDSEQESDSFDGMFILSSN
jgi:hypothetical protein